MGAMSAGYFVLAFLWINLAETFGCPFNCQCTEFKSICNIVFDVDELDLNADLLIVNGALKARHYIELDKKPALKKELHDSSCRTLVNCE